jgi:hypothetical protein
MAPSKKRVVTDQHKAAMAEGRTQSRSIAAYLDALETHKPKRGRKRTPESVDKRLEAIDKQLGSANAIKRLSLIQERLDLLREKNSMGGEVDLTAFEDDFVAAAAGYSERKGCAVVAALSLVVVAMRASSIAEDQRIQTCQIRVYAAEQAEGFSGRGSQERLARQLSECIGDDPSADDEQTD